MPNPTNSIARGIAGDLSATEQSAIRSAIGIAPEQTLSVWGSQIVGNYTSSLDVNLAQGKVIAYCEDQDAIMVVPNSGTTIYIGEANVNGGIDWSTVTAPASLNTNSRVIASESTFVLYSEGGASLYTTTNKGSSFTTVSFPDTNADIEQISYGNGLFVAAGDAMDYYTSTDGVTWTDRGEFGTGGYNTVSLLEYSETLSRWILSARTTGGAFATYEKTDPTAGGAAWTVTIANSNASYEFGLGYDCSLGFVLASLSNGATYIHNGSSLNLDNQQIKTQLTDFNDFGVFTKVFGNGLNLLFNDGEVFYNKSESDHSITKVQSPTGGTATTSNGCYAGGSFNQFLIVDTNGVIYYSLRG